ncbi:MAG: translation initiation factor IF-3 [Ignavibacteriales bacterium]|nr:translation initiation factor IF-3 [Ignavibacteriales bacterium]
MNYEITAPQVRVINHDGQQLGILSVKEAIKKAEEQNLDLIEIAPQADPPVCKIMNFGKYAYELQKKEKLQKKKQHVIVLKEIRLHPNTDTHDFEFKLRHALNFLDEGNKVKVAVIFKGRELAYKEVGENLLKKFIEGIGENGKIEQDIKFEGRAMSAIIAPVKIKK